MKRKGDGPGRLRPWVGVMITILTAGDIGRRSAVAAEPNPGGSERTLDEIERARVDAVRVATPSAISIFVPGGAGGGSGVLISEDGYALTNFHVTSPAGEFMRCSTADGEMYDAVIVGIDPVGDLALIKLSGEGFDAATIADSDRVRPGDECLVIGNPFLLAENLQPTLTRGILSGVGRYQEPSGTLLEYGDCLQTDASVNPGNSGGPIYDAAGRLIGIVGRCSFEKRGRVNVGVGYAISINQALNFVGTLHCGLIADHATLGATLSTDPDGGVRVSNILDDSDAYRRGLRYDHEILSIDGHSVSTANEALNVLATLPARWRVPLEYRDDDGGEVSTVVRLAAVHAEDELLRKMSAAMPPPPPARPAPSTPGEESETPGGGQEEATPKIAASPERADVPDELAKMYEAERGLANGWFNRRAVHRNVRQLKTSPPLPAVFDAAEATVTIRPAGGGEASSWSIGDEPDYTSDDAYRWVSEGTAESLRVAIDQLRSLVRRGPAEYGVVLATGAAPLAGTRPLRNLTRLVRGGVETTLYQHPDTGQLEAMDLKARDGVDPIEVWFRDGTVELRRGLTTVERYAVDVRAVDNEEAAGSATPSDVADPTQRSDSSSPSLHRRLNLASEPRPVVPPPLGDAIDAAGRKVVKIYGAGGGGGGSGGALEAYQSGLLVSPAGHIATAWSYVLDVEPRVVLADGSSHMAKIVDISPELELAVIKIPVNGLPYFEVGGATADTFDTEAESFDDSGDLSRWWGRPVIALSNLFNIAAGPEPVSAMFGHIAAVAPLDARRGTYDTPYRGDVLVLDLVANNPGAAGGALVGVDGRLLGMLGKELRDGSTGVWLNYALPVTTLRPAIRDILSGKQVSRPREANPVLPHDESHDAARLGIVLLPDVMERTPAFVDAVRSDTPADAAGIRPDDLVLRVGPDRVGSRDDLRDRLRRIDRRDDVPLTLQRGNRIVVVSVRPDRGRGE